jgi:hypothetical protein
LIELPSTNLPCLSLWNPWGWALFRCGKDLENRPWNSRYRGWLVVQIAMHWKKQEVVEIVDAIRAATAMTGSPPPDINMDEIEAQRGKVIGLVKIDDWKPAHMYKSPWAFAEGYAAHIAQAVELDNKFPVRGWQGFFYLSSEEENKVREGFKLACEKKGL